MAGGTMSCALGTPPKRRCCGRDGAPMTTITTSTSPSRVIERAAALAGAISTRSAATEAARRVPSDLLHDLVAAGCFRMLLPQTHGGSEASLVEALHLFETVARADASTGWIVMIGASGWCDLASLPRETFDDLFRPTADVIVASVFAPGGAITPTDG